MRNETHALSLKGVPGGHKQRAITQIQHEAGGLEAELAIGQRPIDGEAPSIHHGTDLC